MSIHKKLKQARLDAGFSQVELAELAQMEQQAISRYESGKLQLKSKTIEKICKALGLNIKFEKE